MLFSTSHFSTLSQPYFTFEWHNPEIGVSGQLTWTRLLQGFNPPPIFDALHKDLGEYHTQHSDVTSFQYVDYLLKAATDQETCLRGAKGLHQTLGKLGYRALVKKAQICKWQVTYLGYVLKGAVMVVRCLEREGA